MTMRCTAVKNTMRKVFPRLLHYVYSKCSIQFFILSRLHILQQQEVYIYKMQFNIGSRGLKLTMHVQRSK